MKFYRSKFFIICAVLAVLLTVIPSALSLFGYGDLLRGALKTVAKPFEWCASKAGDAVDGFVSVFTGYDELKEENERLKEELSELEDEKHENEVLTEENTWLKTYLKIKTDHPALLMTDATIISRQSGNYATVLTLNRGSINGVKRNMPVITADGVFGYVSEVSLDSCKVVSLVETASSLSAYTDRGNVVGVVEGDSVLREDGICKMTYIDASADIKIGDKVYTGGNGKIYPPGLLIGEVTHIEADEYSRTLIASVKPAVDFENISSESRVMIITGYVTEDK
ncbi:MAG: rod shape-determining protein MreC [Ruminococcaceae bacterium]|nr:rod shape-determining protein MreC [Oscillospiraceae bacterium]